VNGAMFSNSNEEFDDSSIYVVAPGGKKQTIEFDVRFYPNNVPDIQGKYYLFFHNHYSTVTETMDLLC